MYIYHTLYWERLGISYISYFRFNHFLTLLIFKSMFLFSLFCPSFSFYFSSYSTEFLKGFKEAISAFSRSGKVLLWCVYHMLLTSTLLSIHEIGWRCIYLSLDRVVTQFWIIVVFPRSVSKCSLILIQSK